MSGWGKQQDRLVVRVVDVLSGVLSGAIPEPSRRVVASRALLAVEQWLFPVHEDLVLAENADAAARKAIGEEWADDAAVRRWVTETLADHAWSYNQHHELWEEDPEYLGPEGEHPVWALLELSPFARRLRLLQEAAAKTAVGLGGDVGVGAHQIGHWAAGRSRPGEREREALARALGVHPGWLHASRDEQPDMQLYRFASCPCEKPSTMARLGLGREEPDWYDSPAEQDAAVHWCGCGQAWVKDAAGWLLPLPPGEEPTPSDGDSVGLGHPRVTSPSATLDAPWPRALWRPLGRKSRARTAYRASELLAREPQALPDRPRAEDLVIPDPVWGAGSAERLAANATWCRTCRALARAPEGAAGGSWVLLHRSEPRRELSTWTYPTEKDALHHGAHLAMTYLQLDDGPLDRVALDLFVGQAHAQVIARFLELRPDTTQFEVAELVPMRANEF
ncbi:helix-turn-helix domain-containing protein [Streptomyces lavenduligriseus]|uniref:XRE family transcriptional regulator n=1 Tax=Streptomyces lavenduligriseus TaxID=67315 RepID=A0ABT0P6C9_9ACTN|nr:helix-turn-helix domain-containing protein [Streptomyces lavenduligriseus]MCL3999175.1 XRE family transcriptional regulator [Streptomyces lavenduligriseus]